MYQQGDKLCCEKIHRTTDIYLLAVIRNKISQYIALRFSMASRVAAVSAARERVDGIRDNLGYPSQEYLDTLDDKQREGLFKLLHSKDMLIGASVVSLVAPQLYLSIC